MARRFFFGSFRDDTIFTRGDSDWIFSGGGDDYIVSRGGNDVIFSGSGHDVIRAGSGNDYVYAGSGNDTIYGNSGDDLVYGGTGDDSIYGGSGEDFLSGGSGEDDINGGRDNDVVYGDSGNDRLSGSQGDDSLFGESGDDAIYGGSGLDFLSGGTGNDSLYGGSGNDALYGESGNDRLAGNRGEDLLSGGDGDDLLYGGHDNDLLDGGTGDDSLYGQAGHDVFNIWMSEETGGGDFIHGGSGVDTLVLNLSAEEYASQAVADDLDALLAYMADGMGEYGEVSSNTLDLTALNLRVKNIEAVRVYIDGVEFDPSDAGPDTGGNTDPIAEDDTFFAGENEAISENVTTNDTFEAGTTVTLVSGVTQGTLVLNEDGSFSFDAGNEFDSLADGETTDVSFTYELSGGGETNTATTTITITGTNDAPVVSAPLTGVASEDGSAVTLDLLANATDVDSESLSITDISSIPEDVGVTIDGTTLTLDPAAGNYSELAQGETAEIVVTYTISDGADGSVEQTATLIVTGTNNAPTVDAVLTATIFEDDEAITTIDLLSGAADVDNGSVLSLQNITGLTDGLALDEGSILSIDPLAFQSLDLNAEQTITVAYEVVDEFGATVAQTAEITITGANDAPTVAAALVAAGSEDGTAITVDLLNGASDVDTNAVLTVTNVAGLIAGVILDGDTLTVDASDAAFQTLAAGETQIITVTYDIVDENEAAVAQTATITLTGTNDAPTVETALAAAGSEDGPAITLDLLDGASDIDNNAVLTVANVAGLIAGVTLDGDTLTVDASDAAFQALAAGETQIITVTYDIVDENEAAVAQTATITLTGTNDAPTVETALAATGTEDGSSVTLDLLDGASDVDNSAVLTIANVTGLTDGMSLEGTDLTLDPSDIAFQELAEGETLDLTVSFDVVDENGASVSQTATFTVTGTNDDPNVEYSAIDLVAEDEAVIVIDLLDGVTDIDNNATLSIANLTGLVPGLTVDGTSIVVDPSDDTFQSLAVEQTQEIVLSYDVVDEFGASVSQTSTIIIEGTNDAPTAVAAGTSFGEDLFLLDFNLLASASDLDQGATLYADFGESELPDGFTLLDDGETLRIQPRQNEDAQALADGETLDFVITYQIVDEFGASVDQTVTFTVLGANDAPSVSINLPTQEVGFDEAYELELSETMLFDAEGDRLTLSATLADGSALPSWLSFDLETGTLSGTPTTTDGGGFTVVITAEDGNGGVGTDTINFAIGDGVILGTDDGETLNGTTGNDTFISGLGDDTLLGSGGNDVYIFNAGDGNDTVREASSYNTTDTIVFNDYNRADATFTDITLDSYTISFSTGDSVRVENGLTSLNTFIESIQFADETIGFEDIRAELLAAQSTDGDDTIIGTRFDDVIDGGLGNDDLQGGSGNDTYQFSAGDGQNVVTESLSYNTTDTIVFTDLNLADATFTNISNSSYTIEFANGDSVRVVNGLSSANTYIESIQFADQTLDFDQIRTALLEAQSTEGDDVIVGTRFADVITDDAGNDVLLGGAGNDTYQFSAGDGQNVVREELSFNTTDRIVFTDFDLADATFVQLTSTDYRIEFDNGDSVTVENGFGSANTRMEIIEFRDQTLNFDDIILALNEAQGTDGDDLIIGTNSDDQALSGGAGTDRLEGNSGNDRYIFREGDGQDTIRENLSYNTTDVIEFPDYDAAEATFVRIDSNSYSVSFANGDIVIADQALGSANRRIEFLEFADQTLDITAVEALLDANTATEGDDILFGSNLDDNINGGAGADIIDGTAGNDTLLGGLGADLLIGGTGNDLIDGGAGADRIEFASGDGSDLIIFDASDEKDTLSFIDYNRDDADFIVDGTDLIIAFANRDSVIVEDAFDPEYGAVGTVEFLDQTLSIEEIGAEIIVALQTDGDDYIEGFETDDTFEGGAGNDFIAGNGGDDTYLFDFGDGHDAIIDTSGNDTIDFGSFSSEEAIVYEFQGNLVIEFSENDSVEIITSNPELNVVEGPESEFASVDQLTLDGSDELVGLETGSNIETYVFADRTLDYDDILLLISDTIEGVTWHGTSDNERVFGTFGDDSINSYAGDDALYGGSGNDTLSGGSGDNRLFGGDGDDNFIYSSGGLDFISDFQGDNDQLIIVGYSLADATLIIGQDNEHAILFSNNQETGEVDGIIGAEEIELFVFVPNFFEPEVYETYTYDQLFGDFEGIYDNNFGGLYDDIYGPDETEYEDIYLDFDIGEPPVILV